MARDRLAERVVARFAQTDPGTLAEQFRASIIQAVKRVGDGVRRMGLGAGVKYNPQERIDQDSHGVHGTFFLRFEHPKVNPLHRPGINFYWNLSKGTGTVGTSQLVWRAKVRENLPLAKMAPAMLEAADDILLDLKRQMDASPSTETLVRGPGRRRPHDPGPHLLLQSES